MARDFTKERLRCITDDDERRDFGYGFANERGSLRGFVEMRETTADEDAAFEQQMTARWNACADAEAEVRRLIAAPEITLEDLDELGAILRRAIYGEG
jgi:hypothetical protein